jgi:hypothetical protein
MCASNQQFLPLISQKTLDSKRYGGGIRWISTALRAIGSGMPRLTITFRASSAANGS